MLPRRAAGACLCLAPLLALLLAGCAAPGPGGPGGPGPEPAARGLDFAAVPPLAGRVLWRAALPGNESGMSSPLLADLDGDGRAEVVQANGWEEFATGAAAPRPSAGAVSAWDASTGGLRWSTPAGAVDASPAWADVTGDGAPEVVVGLRSRGQLALVDPASGRIAAALDLGNWVHSPALRDVDGDGVADAVVVTGGAEEAGKGPGRAGEVLAARARGGSFEVLWRHTLDDEAYASPAVGQAAPGVPVVLLGLGGQLSAGGAMEARDARTGALRWRASAPTGVLASPVLVDLDGDGAKEGVFVAWWGTVHARRALDGAVLWEAATGHLTWTSPAVAELTGDGRPDVVLAGYRTPGLHFRGFEQDVNGKFSLARGDGGLVTALDGPTGRVLWARDLPGMTPGSPVTADLDGDGRAEVLVAVGRGRGGYFGADPGGLLVLDGRTGEALGALALPGAVVATPAVGDVDGDGRPEVALATAAPHGAQALLLGLDRAWAGDAPWTWPRWRGSAAGVGEAPAAGAGK